MGSCYSKTQLIAYLLALVLIKNSRLILNYSKINPFINFRLNRGKFIYKKRSKYFMKFFFINFCV